MLLDLIFFEDIKFDDIPGLYFEGINSQLVLYPLLSKEHPSFRGRNELFVWNVLRVALISLDYDLLTSRIIDNLIN